LGGAVHFIRSVSRGLIAFDGDTVNLTMGFRQQRIAFFSNFFQEPPKPTKSLGKCGASMGQNLTRRRLSLRTMPQIPRGYSALILTLHPDW
jgi:hypothetical protein